MSQSEAETSNNCVPPGMSSETETELGATIKGALLIFCKINKINAYF